MKLRLIPPGDFMMGNAEDKEGRGRVRITRPFYLGVYEVTQAEYEQVMGSQPWSGMDDVKQGPSYPASCISWVDAAEFCKRLSEREGREYRLPSEAEWEYACRAGTTTCFCFGDSDSELGEYAWYKQNAYDVGEEYAHQVGQKQANAWGLYDMHGNVWEWCSDWYDEDYQATLPADDPIGPATGSDRVCRGGSWSGNARKCRSAFRDAYEPDDWSYGLGFRVILAPPE